LVFRLCLDILADLSSHGPLILNLNIPAAPNGQLVCLPVSQVDYDERYYTLGTSPEATTLKLEGENLVPDPQSPDLAALDTGAVVVNVLPTLWTRGINDALAAVVAKIRERPLPELN
jgi:hypothetical protein